MSAPLIVALPGNEALAQYLAKGLDGEVATTEFRRFPDGESYVRVDTPVEGRSVILACTLDRPDEKFLMLMFAAATVRELGAIRIGLVAPYLCYLRQDKRFRPGEAVTSATFCAHDVGHFRLAGDDRPPSAPPRSRWTRSTRFPRVRCTRHR